MGRVRVWISASNPSSTTTNVRPFDEALWIAIREIKWAWPSYVLTFFVVLFLGSAAAVSLSGGVSELEGSLEGPIMGHQMTRDFYAAFFADYLFLLVCAVLGANTISRYYTQNWRDTFASRLAFLRCLPISAVVLVGSRMISMLFALLLNALAFFLPIFFLSGLGEELGVETYRWFCAVWIGYGLLGSGLCLYFEFGVSGRMYALISYGFALTLMIVVAYIELTKYAGLVVEMAQLVQSGYGSLLIYFSILGGGASFLLLSIATVNRLQNRDPPT